MVNIQYAFHQFVSNSHNLFLWTVLAKKGERKRQDLWMCQGNAAAARRMKSNLQNFWIMKPESEMYYHSHILPDQYLNFPCPEKQRSWNVVKTPADIGVHLYQMEF